MTTLQQLTTAAKLKGYKYEAFTSMFYNRGDGYSWDAKDKGTSYFQFTTDGIHYYWFKGWTMEDGTTDMYFEERYSANSGYSIRTYKRKQEALKKLNINN